MWPAVDLNLMQSLSMAISFFARVKDHLHSRSLLSRLRESSTLKTAVKNILKSMGETFDWLKDGTFHKLTPRAVFVLSPRYAQFQTIKGRIAGARL